MTTSFPLRTALLGAVVVTAALEAVYYFGGIEGVRDDTPLRAAAVGTLGAAVAALLLWRWCRDAGARELGARSGRLGVLAGLSFLGFWIGLFGPVCATAVLAGSAAIGTGRLRAGWFAVGAGVLAAAAATVMCVLGAS